MVDSERKPKNKCSDFLEMKNKIGQKKRSKRGHFSRCHLRNSLLSFIII